jgi:DNA-directed RNA polymerase III subunit RPC2
MMSTGTEIYGPTSFVVHVNGLIIGVTRFPARFVAQFRKLRRAGKINEFVGIYINHHHKTVNIASDGGRICRPLIIVEHTRPKVTSEHIQVRSSFLQLGKETPHSPSSAPESRENDL